MAYHLRELREPCDRPGCNRRAAVELVDNFNASRGRYCRTCGQRRLLELTGGAQTASPAPARAGGPGVQPTA